MSHWRVRDYAALGCLGCLAAPGLLLWAAWRLLTLPVSLALCWPRGQGPCGESETG